MDGATGYKYIRATFSNSLSSLSEADIEIRDVKTGQLYSVEKVALSTDGYTADITIAGDAAVSGTTFLMPSTIYSCKIDADGARSTLEFQLPNIFADVMVSSVDIEKNTITVFGSVRKGGQVLDRATTLNVGDSYEENLGELVGRTLVIGVDADNNITSLKVNDGEVAFGYVTAKDGDNDNLFNSTKDYFETATKEKYYLSNSYTSASNYTYFIDADNSGGAAIVTRNTIDKGDTFEYAKMILNPNGTVSAAVLWDAFDGHIIATDADGSVAKETSDNSKDFKGYTVIDGFTFDYRDPKSLEDGDIIYYDSDDKLAFVYNENVEGDLEAVYEDKLDIDGTKYNFIVWTKGHDYDENWIEKQARYYDAENDEYKKVTEKWANTIDKTEPVTIFLDTKGDGVLVEGTVGETVTHSKQYIITKSPKAYINGLSYMMDMSVSDGTETTLHINAADITSMNGDAFGDVTFDAANLAGGKYVFTITDHDGKKTSLNAAGKAVKNNSSTGSDTAIASTVFQQGSLVEVIYNDDETKVTGLNLILGNQTNMTKGTLNNRIADINMKVNKDVEFKGELASVKTNLIESLNLTDSTKVYVLTGTRLPVGELENDDLAQNDTNTNRYKEASDNKVKVYNYSDFDKNTQAGNYALCKITTEADANGDGEVVETSGTTGITVGSLVRFVADGTTAKAVVIDDRGWNNAINTHDTGDHLGTVRAANDIKGGQVFKTAETKTYVLGIVTATEYQLNSDGETNQLAEAKILTSAGTVTLDDIDAKIDTDQDSKNKIVVAELDASGKMTKLNEFAPAAGAAAVEQVNFGYKLDSTSTDTLTVTSTADNYSVKTDSNCLVVKYNGTSYSESTIGDINRDDDYVAVKFYTTQLNGTDAKAKVIVAVKSGQGAGYVPSPYALVYDDDELEAGDTMTVKLVDQFGNVLNSGNTWASSDPTVAKFDPTPTATDGTVTVEGLSAGTTTISSQGESFTLTVTLPESYTPVATSLDVTSLTSTYGSALASSNTVKVLDQYGEALKGDYSYTINAATTSIDTAATASTTTAPGVAYAASKGTFNITTLATTGAGTYTVEIYDQDPGTVAADNLIGTINVTVGKKEISLSDFTMTITGDGPAAAATLESSYTTAELTQETKYTIASSNLGAFTVTPGWTSAPTGVSLTGKVLTIDGTAAVEDASSVELTIDATDDVNYKNASTPLVVTITMTNTT